VRKKYLFLLMVVVFVSMFGNVVWAGDKYVKGIIHAHDTNSDGLFPQTMYRPWFKTTGCKYFYQTDHFDCLVGKCDHKSHQKRSFNYVLEYLKQQTSPYFRGIECFTELNGQHILLLGSNWNSLNSLYKANTGQILAYAKNNNLVSILAHPHDGYKLEYINDFTALEFFNTKGFDLSQLSKRIKNEKYDKAEDLDLEIYCQAAKQYINGRENNMPGITGGCDIHFSDLELSFGLTFVAVPDVKKIDLFSIISSVAQGKTCAVFSNIIGMRAWIDSLNYQPNRSKIYKTKKIRLKGKITAENCNKLYVYVDGNKYQELDIDVNKRSINFDLPIDAGTGKHVVFLYCKNRLITSPIIFDVTGEEIPAVASTPTSTVSPAPAVVKPKKFIESLQFHSLPYSGTSGGYYMYIVKDETGKVVFKTRLGRHDCVLLIKKFIIIACPIDVNLWDRYDDKVPYYGQYYIYNNETNNFRHYLTIGGTSKKYKAGYAQSQHVIKNRNRNFEICIDIIQTFSKYCTNEKLNQLKNLTNPLDKQILVFLETMPIEIVHGIFYIQNFNDVKKIKYTKYRQYANADITTRIPSSGVHIIFKNEESRWRIIYASTDKVFLPNEIPNEVFMNLGWKKDSIVKSRCEYFFYP